jgi:hypothetical protein
MMRLPTAISYLYVHYLTLFFVSIPLIIQAKKQVESPPGMCWPENEDYFECLHGFKEKARQMEVVKERKRREKLGESFEIKL